VVAHTTQTLKPKRGKAEVCPRTSGGPVRDRENGLRR
jgi:hypothetical protein